MILDNKNLKVHEWIAKYTKEGKFSLVPGIVYATEAMLKTGDQQEPLKQVADVATLPGILKASLAMPDMHWGYGSPFSQLIERRVEIKKI